MKRWLLAVVLLLFSLLNTDGGFAADTWTDKIDFGGVERCQAVGFSIGSKGYIGTGMNELPPNGQQDFWEYDPAADTWTQKADFGGGPRYGAVGFSIGSKGYVGTGSDGTTPLRDFWEYDPIANIWSRKADVGGITAGYLFAAGFSIGGKGYIGTGLVGSTAHVKDFWEYDPAADTWTRKADVGGTERYGAVGFSIGGRGYIGTGSGSTGYVRDFWEYDPAADTWTRRADFGGAARSDAVSFVIGGRGYVGTGVLADGGRTREFWEYDPIADTWTQRADFGGAARDGAASFAIGGRGYVATGSSLSHYFFFYYGDLWEYTPAETTNAVTMTFVGLTHFENVAAYYNGGYGYNYFTNLPLSGPGPNYGVTFSNIQASIDEDTGRGNGNFGGEPSPDTAISMQSNAVMNVANGFKSLSFYYSNPNNNSKIYIYSGPNRTGTLLKTHDLPRTPYHGAPDPTGNLSPFVRTAVSFTGVGKSVDFSGEQFSAYIDDLTLLAVDIFAIDALASGSGFLSPSAKTARGSNITFAITPAAHHRVANVLVDGISVGAVESYTFTNVTANHIIEALFAADTFTITAAAGANGSISPSATVSHGSDATFTITPAARYRVADVLVDGISVGAVQSYTFTNVTANHAIEAFFAADTFTITAAAGGKGSISPWPSVTVDHGSNVTFTFAARAGYQLADVLVDGISVGAVGSYTFTNVNADHTVLALFVLESDLNNDGKVDLTDAVMALQALSGIVPALPLHKWADIDGDGRIGMAEVVYIMQRSAGLRTKRK
jgi:N-acetylneuraminic acid mutarotase